MGYSIVNQSHNHMKRIMFLMSLALLCWANIGAQVNVINAKDFKKMHVNEVCKIGDGAIAAIMDLEIPMFSASLQKYLAKKMFNSNEVSLLGAVNMFLSAYGVGDKNDLIDLSLTFVTYAASCVSYSPGKYVTFLVRYPDPEKLMGRGEIERVTRYFVYDISREKVLAYEDIFSAEYIDVFYPDSEHNDFLFKLDYDYLSYGKDSTLVNLPLCQIQEYLTPQFRHLIDWGMVNSRAKNLNINNKGMREIQTALKKKEAAIKKLNSEKEALYQLYLADKKPYKQIHLYMHNDECWVSGLNKDITKLTTEDIALLEKKSKQLLNEISVMKDWLKQKRGENVDDSIYIFQPESSRLPNQDEMLDIYEKLGEFPKMNELLIGNKMDEYVRARMSLKHDTIYAKVICFVNKDGKLSCPVILEGKDVEVNKEIIGILRKYKTKPYIVDGNPVRACVMQSFSYVKTKINIPHTRKIEIPSHGRTPRY